MTEELVLSFKGREECRGSAAYGDVRLEDDLIDRHHRGWKAEMAHSESDEECVEYTRSVH